MHMRFLVLFFLILMVSGMVWGAPVYAHQIKTSGTMSILQHSDPNDEPVAGMTTTLYLNITDSAGTFSAQHCDCTVYIAPYRSLETIETTGVSFDFETGLTHTYNENYSLEYVFPDRDVYAIVVEGAPRESGKFSPFRIVFDIRVAHEVSPSKEDQGDAVQAHEQPYGAPYRNLMHITLTTGILSVLISLAILVRKRIKK